MAQDKAKYKLLNGKNDRKTLEDGTEVFRIQATRQIYHPTYSNISEGQLGGWVENYQTLDQFDNSWIGKDAIVTGQSVVKDRAFVESGRVHDCTIEDDACVDLDTDPAYKITDCDLHNHTKIAGFVIASHCELHEYSEINGKAVAEYVKLYGKSEITGSRDGTVVRWCSLGIGVEIVGNAHVEGKDGDKYGESVYIKGWMKIGRDAMVTHQEDVLTIGSIGSEGGVLTVYRTKARNTLMYIRGCFTGTESEFRAAIRETHGRTKHATRYRKLIDYANSHFGIRKPTVKAK